MKKLRFLIPLIFVLGLLAVPTLVFAHQQTKQSTVFYACENNQGGIDPNSITQNDSILQSGSCVGSNVVVKWSVTGPQGPIGLTGDIGPTGTQGPKGDSGANGTNGSNVLTSDSVPTGTCTSGDSDIALSTDEVYSCAASSWVDTNHTVKGDKGDPGLQGTQGPKGDSGPAGPAGVPFTHPACSEKLNGSAQQENLVFCISDIEPDGGPVYTAAINAAKVRILVGTPLSTAASVDWGNQAITYVEFTSAYHAEYHNDGIVRFYNALNQRVF